MNKQLQGTRTEANLHAAFAGESMAKAKYSYYASTARKEGYETIAGIFQETADNELAHAKIWFNLLQGIGDTKTNLLKAAEGEQYEWTSMYKEFAETATAEGFADIAALFSRVGQIEKEHEERYRELVANVANGNVFRKTEQKTWRCRVCGHRHEGKARKRRVFALFVSMDKLFLKYSSQIIRTIRKGKTNLAALCAARFANRQSEKM